MSELTGLEVGFAVSTLGLGSILGSAVGKSDVDGFWVGFEDGSCITEGMEEGFGDKEESVRIIKHISSIVFTEQSYSQHQTKVNTYQSQQRDLETQKVHQKGCSMIH